MQYENYSIKEHAQMQYENYSIKEKDRSRISCENY